ncbi:MAG: FecR family protein [Bacteroidota bacterium]
MDIDELIYKKLNGTATPEEVSELIKWLNSDEKNPFIYQGIENHWKGEKENLKQYKANTWDGLLEKIHVAKKEAPTPVRVVSNNKNPFSIDIWKFAASLLILLIASYTLWINYKSKPVPIKQAIEVEMNIRYNPAGVKSTITLPDKSVVKLNSESKLSFPKVFSGLNRKVYLEGEAFFEVEENPQKPFIIQTGELNTEVKGTSFNINAFPDRNKVSIAVVSGLVSVYDSQKEIAILPGELALYELIDNSSNQLNKRNFESEEIAWKDGIIVFREASFTEVKETLERWYGIKIKLQRNISFQQGFTGSYEHEPLNSVMESISFAGEFHYKIDTDSNQVIIW